MRMPKSKEFGAPKDRTRGREMLVFAIGKRPEKRRYKKWTRRTLHAAIVREVRKSPLASMSRLSGWLGTDHAKMAGALDCLVREGVLVEFELNMSGRRTIMYDVVRSCDKPPQAEVWDPVPDAAATLQALKPMPRVASGANA